MNAVKLPVALVGTGEIIEVGGVLLDVLFVRVELDLEVQLPVLVPGIFVDRFPSVEDSISMEHI